MSTELYSTSPGAMNDAFARRVRSSGHLKEPLDSTMRCQNGERRTISCLVKWCSSSQLSVRPCNIGKFTLPQWSVTLDARFGPIHFLRLMLTMMHPGSKIIIYTPRIPGIADRCTVVSQTNATESLLPLVVIVANGQQYRHVVADIKPNCQSWGL
jgi:hypothetical protein